jgi:hypothetical protein
MILTPAMSAFGAIMGFCGVTIWRIREGRSAVTKRKILIPHYREPRQASISQLPGGLVLGFGSPAARLANVVASGRETRKSRLLPAARASPP